MKKTIILFGVLLLFVASCTIQKEIVEPVEPEPTNKEICEIQGKIFVDGECLDEAQITGKELCEQEEKLWLQQLQGFECIEKTAKLIGCEVDDGEWKQFSNTCVDNCGKKPRICGQAFTLGCDCGETKCWDGTKCINDTYEPYATEQKACEETRGKWLESVCPPPDCTIINGEEICRTFVCSQQKCECSLEHKFTIQGCTTEEKIKQQGLLSVISY